MSSAVPRVRYAFYESRSSGLERKVGGKFHLKLNIGSRPIANKYHEGKVKRTLKRASMRVRIPFVICSPPCTVCFLRVTFLGIGAQIGW